MLYDLVLLLTSALSRDDQHHLLFHRKTSKSHSNILELLELSNNNEIPRIGLRLIFPDTLFPFAFICKNEEKFASGNQILLYDRTMSVVAFLIRLKNNFDYGAFSLVPTDEIIEYNTQMQPYIGRSDGSAGYFQLGMVDPSAPGFVSELRDDTGFGLLWGILSSLVSRIMSNPGPEHWQAVKWTLGYLKGSQDVGLNYTNRWTEREKIEGYADSDFAGDQDTMKSQTGYVFTLYGNTISWKANLQPILALSITDAEYVAATEAFKDAYYGSKA